MASVHGYTTLTALENYLGIDLSSFNSDYTDTKVEAMITIAERLVNGYLGSSLSGTIPDAIQSATIIITENIIHNRMVRDGVWDKDTVDSMNDLAKDMLDKYIAKEGQDEVDFINLYSGRIDYPAHGGWYYPW